MGKWEVIYDHGWHVVDVTDKSPGGQILICDCGIDPWSEMNAHKIAAAPELAEALRMVVAADTAEDWSRAVDYARAALAKDNGGKPLGVSCTQPIPLYEAMPASHKPTYDDAAIRELIVTIQSNREAIRRALEAWDTTTNSKSHDGHLWQCMEELRMEIEK